MIKMAECKTETCGPSQTSLDTVESFWERLLEMMEYDNEREELNIFFIVQH